MSIILLKHRIPIAIFFSLLLFNQNLFANSIADKLTGAQHVHVVWTTDHGIGEQVFFSKYNNNGWTDPVQVSQSNDFVFHSTSSMSDNGVVWVVWSQSDADGYYLYYSLSQGIDWSQPKKIETGESDNRFPSILHIQDIGPILTWTSPTNTYSDIFWTKWDGIDWEPPKRAHNENHVPDVDPHLSVDESGQVILEWQSFVSGKYTNIIKRLDFKQTKAENLLSDQKVQSNEIHGGYKPFHLPNFLEHNHKATLYIKNEEGEESVTLHQLD